MVLSDLDDFFSTFDADRLIFKLKIKWNNQMTNGVTPFLFNEGYTYFGHLLFLCCVFVFARCAIIYLLLLMYLYVRL